MPAFTKGHWTVENGIDIISDIHQNAYIAQLYLIPDEKEHEANARLIAAAPEMYRILCDIREWCEVDDLDPDIEEDIAEVLQAIHGKEDNGHDTDA